MFLFVANLHNFVSLFHSLWRLGESGSTFKYVTKKTTLVWNFFPVFAIFSRFSIYLFFCTASVSFILIEWKIGDLRLSPHTTFARVKEKHVWSARWFEAQWNYPSPRWCAVSFERDSDFFVFSVDSFFSSSAVCFFSSSSRSRELPPLAHTAEMLSLGWWIYGGNFVCASAPRPTFAYNRTFLISLPCASAR